MKSPSLSVSKFDPALASVERQGKKVARPGTYVPTLANMTPPVAVPGVGLGNLIPKPPKAKGFK